MKHHKYKKDFKFVKDPIEFNKYTEKEILKYCLGATLYMPGTRKIADAIIQNKMEGLTSIVMCFEDAIAPDQLDQAEENVLNTLEILTNLVENGSLSINDIPLIFFRVRSPIQFRKFTSKINSRYTKIISGFVFPKFTTQDGYDYLSHLKEINLHFNDILYGMPILESHSIAYRETRDYELMGLKSLLKPYQDLILNIRVGATDFSSNFGVRRGIDYSIYDILTVRDILSDILNFLSREDDDYVISGPVWEYFLADKKINFDQILDNNIHKSIIKGNNIINDAIDGLLREVIIDKANGFVGKTIIHPSHMRFVNAMFAVTKEEYEDALQVLDTSGGVIKSTNNNKMNEINPHSYWAKKIYSKAQAYGVVEDEMSYVELFFDKEEVEDAKSKYAH